MKALVRSGGRVAVTDRADPPVGPGHVAIEVALAGICRTDLYVAEGRLPSADPVVLGHELAGIIVEAREAPFSAGETVTVVPRVEGVGFLGVDRDGAFAQRVVVPAANVLRVPSSMPWRVAAYVEPVAATLAILDALEGADSILVMGAGRIAELASRVLAAHGIDHDRTPSRPDYRCVVETSATEGSLRTMLDLVAPGGTAVLKSRPPAPVPIDLALATRKRVTLRCVDYGSWQDAIALLASRRLSVDDLLGETFALDDFDRGFASAGRAEAKKIFLDPRGS